MYDNISVIEPSKPDSVEENHYNSEKISSDPSTMEVLPRDQLVLPVENEIYLQHLKPNWKPSPNLSDYYVAPIEDPV